MAGVVGTAAAAMRCMNPACGAPAPAAGGDWRKGWPLRSGGLALLCDKCGYGLSPLCPLCLSDPPAAPGLQAQLRFRLQFCYLEFIMFRLAYEQLVFCDIFHQKESGWRDCSFCGKVRCSSIVCKFLRKLYCNSAQMMFCYFSVSIADALLPRTLMIYLMGEEFNVSLA
ncbi:hypothetical protein PR202_ga28785 [Eleusine coracana subsp. coracana]|uniref:Uncharacterized protein n=1 Tax=Eleusine coracana subsp. coracana TaxID=191504 RepID=A0AAV5DJP5_ELECO|nr:hypothetical protein PR202_ga28785 [Eleusine coracana subsp. coracana]